LFWHTLLSCSLSPAHNLVFNSRSRKHKHQWCDKHHGTRNTAVRIVRVFNCIPWREKRPTVAVIANPTGPYWASFNDGIFHSCPPLDVGAFAFHVEGGEGVFHRVEVHAFWTLSRDAVTSIGDHGEHHRLHQSALQQLQVYSLSCRGLVLHEEGCL
jgi:hypothetical protein